MADAAEPEPEPEPAEEGGKKGKTAKDMTEDEAATKIQAAVRGKKGRGKKKKKALVQLMVETEAYPEDQRAELEELDLKKLRKMAKKAGVPKAEIHRVAPLQGSKKKNLAGAAGAAKQTAAEKAKAVNELRDDSAVGSPGVTTSIAFAYRGQSFLSPYDAALLHGIAEGLAPTEHDLMVVNTARGRGLGGSLGQTLIRRGVAGVVFRAATKDHGLFSELATERFPTVVIAERIESEHIGCVHFDAELAIAQALSHLVQQGHRKIAIALNAIDDYDHAQRFAAYQHFLAKHDLPTDDRWIIRSPGWDSNGGSALRKLMALPDRPTAIFMTDPGLGSGLCIEALRMGVRIPQDLSVIGFDDSEGRYDTFPRLSSVCQHVGLLGETALQHLLDVIARRSAPREIKLECSFEPLDSTAAPFSDL